MRIIIASDIHGRTNAAKRLEAVIASLRPDRVVLLGDYLYNGPRNGVPSDYDPMAVSTILNRFAPKVIGIRGNCDSRIDETLLRFTMENSKVCYFNGFRCDLIHGDLLTSDLLSVSRGDVLMYGHTHVPTLKKADGVTYVNPGSISFPKGGYPPTYAVMDGSRVEIRNLDDDIPILAMDLI
ncbi:MAG: phosphodiesterase [Bacilli bacterium]|nr:phosphodiesterase [Bacilli bacterium]